jgi:hypothetical protein
LNLSNYEAREIGCCRKIKRLYTKDVVNRYGHAFVTFKDSKYRFKSLKEKGLPEAISNFKAYAEKNHSDDILWENHGISIFNRVIRFLVSWGITILILVVNSMILWTFGNLRFNYQHASEYWNESSKNFFFDLGINYTPPSDFIYVFLTFLPLTVDIYVVLTGLILKLLTVFENHKSKKDQSSSYIAKIALFYTINVIFPVLIIPLLNLLTNYLDAFTFGYLFGNMSSNREFIHSLVIGIIQIFLSRVFVSKLVNNLEIIIVDFLKFIYTILKFCLLKCKKKPVSFKMGRITHNTTPLIANDILIFSIVTIISPWYPSILLFAIPYYLDSLFVERWKLSYIYKTGNSGNLIFESLTHIFLLIGMFISFFQFFFYFFNQDTSGIDWILLFGTLCFFAMIFIYFGLNSILVFFISLIQCTKWNLLLPSFLKFFYKTNFEEMEFCHPSMKFYKKKMEEYEKNKIELNEL